MPATGGRHRWGALTDRLGGTRRVLVRELSAFGVVGAAAFVVDLVLFQALYAHASADAVAAKLAATVVATSVAFAGHRWWSFSARVWTGLRREYVAFAAVNLVTLCLGLGIVAVVHHGFHQDGALVLQVTNVATIALGTVARFLAYRRWVFPAVPVSARDEVGPGVLTR